MICDVVYMAQDEKNEKMKSLIRKKVDEYLTRAEKLKVHITKMEEPARVKANGTTNGSSGGKKWGLHLLST
jgi:vacuolar protein-sorting-associated protein 4